LLAGLLIPALCGVCALAGAAVTAPDFDAALREADSLRSSDAKRFAEHLAVLKARVAEASIGQQQRLRYLDAYHKVVYGNALDAGIKQAQALFRETEDIDLKFRAGSLAVNGFAINRKFTDGLRHLNQTLAIRRDVKDKDIRHDGTNVAAVLYNQLGQYELGLRYAEETLADGPSPRAGCFAEHFRVEARYYLGRLPKDDEAIKTVVARCAVLNENITANLARAIQARHLAAHGRRNDAIQLLEAHLAQVDALGYAGLIAEFRSLLARLQLERGEQDAAEQHALAAIEHEASIAGARPLADAFKTLYEVAERRGDLSQALSYYRSYAKADKDWLNEVKTRELAYQIVRHETLQQTQQIELLNKQNELLQLQQQVQQQNAQNTRLLVLLLLLLLASIAFWAYKTKRVQMSLKRMAETDALTGICNRHHFTHQSELALAQCARAGEDVALVMFDLDHFKSINDRFGHDTGDWVLKQVVAACAPVCRRIDYFGRIGGEEFAILLIGMDARGAKRLAEDCRVRIAGIESGGSGYLFKPSASFGVTTTALSGYDLAKMLSHADKMLYRAKRGGRNRVFVYEVPVPVQLPVPVGDAHGEPAPVPDAVEQGGDASDGVAVEDRSMQQRAVAVS
jgi:diguanylate cyclase (GGDEF)-like protein